MLCRFAVTLLFSTVIVGAVLEQWCCVGFVTLLLSVDELLTRLAPPLSLTGPFPKAEANQEPSNLAEETGCL